MDDLLKALTEHLRFEFRIVKWGLAFAAISALALTVLWKNKYGADDREFFRITLTTCVWALTGLLLGAYRVLRSKSSSQQIYISPHVFIVLTFALLASMFGVHSFAQKNDGWGAIVYAPLWFAAMITQFLASGALVIFSAINNTHFFFITGYSLWIYYAVKWSILFLERNL